MDIQTAINEHLRDFENIRSPHTIMAYRNGLNTFLIYLKSKNVPPTADLPALRTETFIEYMFYLSREGYAKKTVNVYGSGIKNFVDWLIIHGHLVMDYNQGVRFAHAFKQIHSKREARLPRWPKPDDVQKMIEAVKTMSEESPRLERNIALVLFLASSGCRNAEAAGLKIKDIDIKDCSAVVTGKGSKERRVFFSQETTEALKTYWSARKDDRQDRPVFMRQDRGGGKGKKINALTTTTIRNIIKDVANLAGVDPFSPHYFRHAFAIRMLHETGNLALVQDLMGHANPMATRVYAKIYASDLKAAHQAVYG